MQTTLGDATERAALVICSPNIRTVKINYKAARYGTTVRPAGLNFRTENVSNLGCFGLSVQNTTR
jgi:hypothetical protein